MSYKEKFEKYYFSEIETRNLNKEEKELAKGTMQYILISFRYRFVLLFYDLLDNFRKIK
ncbi:hypothetical protein ACTFH7_02000 [Clostridium cagae]|uniref:hypothetical protein n=1 Tax=Clostridium cagae TaxID=2080751 RepID=UPI003F7646D6